jgi:hypothetical protein
VIVVLDLDRRGHVGNPKIVAVATVHAHRCSDVYFHPGNRDTEHVRGR